MKYLFWFMFVGTVFLANWMIGNVGTFCEGHVCLIPVGFGLYAPSGVLAIGLGFTLRDLVQNQLGLKWAIFGINVGAVLSAYLNPFLAVASGVAFLFSEMLDLTVYTPLKEKNIIWAVIASNIAGIVADSFLFLYIAQIPMGFLPGQIMGKLWMTIFVIPVLWYINNKKVLKSVV